MGANMDAERGYRHELKYQISLGEAALLSTRLRMTLAQDPHAAKNGGSYFIRSLYFDDPYETAVEEKVAGVEFRDKIRIRIYNLSDSSIKLERKHKNGQFILKQSVRLSREECDALVAGDCTFLLYRKEPFAKQMFEEFRTRQLRPKVLVDYDREPFVFPLEDVRITLDRNIRTAMRCTDLFSARAVTYPATEYTDCCILEVKFNQYLPGYVRMLLQLGAAQHTAASKYLFCRQFDV